MRHVEVFREPGRFAGWPANYGVWSWDDEIVVGFTVGYLKPGQTFHARDMSRPFTAMQARSLDGGETWETVRTPCTVPSEPPARKSPWSPHQLVLSRTLVPGLRSAERGSHPSGF